MDNMILYMFHSGIVGDVEEWSGKRALQMLLNGKINTIYYVLSNLVGIEEDRAVKKAGQPVDFTSPKADFLYGGVRKRCLQYVDWAIYIADIFKQYFVRTRFGKFQKENLGADEERD